MVFVVKIAELGDGEAVECFWQARKWNFQFGNSGMVGLRISVKTDGSSASRGNCSRV
jgi:hypothetical protein